MFSKVLVANRGEIAVRAFRAAVRARRAHGRGVPVRGPQRGAPDQGRRGVPDRRAGPPGARLPRRRRDRPGGARVRRRRRLPRLRLPVREPASWPRRARRPGIAFVGPPPEVLSLAGNKVRALAAAREAGIPVLRSSAPVLGRRGAARGGRGRRLPDLRQGRRRWRRARHAPGRAARRLQRGARDRHARGGGRVRRPDGVPRAGRRPAAAHRGAGARRRHGGDAAPVRARLLGAAAAPEGRRDRAGAEPRPATCATRCAATPSRSPGRSATSTPARSSSWSRPRGSGPASTSSSR